MTLVVKLVMVIGQLLVILHQVQIQRFPQLPLLEQEQIVQVLVLEQTLGRLEVLQLPILKVDREQRKQ